MAIADTITSMQTHTSNAYTMIGYGTDLTGINKNLENLSSTIFEAFLEALRNPDTLFTNLPKTSGSGSQITLNGTANAPMRIELGASALIQSPNLFNGNLTSGYIDFDGTIASNDGWRTSNDYIEIEPSTTYVVSGTNMGARVLYGFYNSSKTFISPRNETTPNTQFTSVNNAKYIKFSTNSTTPTNIELKGIPTPSSPQDIHTISGNNSVVVEGKNLCSSAVYYNTNAIYMYFNPKALNKTFTISIKAPKTITGNLNVYLWVDNTNLSRIGYISITNGEIASTTLTLSDSNYNAVKNGTTAFFSLYLSGAGFDTTGTLEQAQIENNNQATTYTPYVSQTAPINLGEYEIGTIGNYSNEFVRSGGESNKLPNTFILGSINQNGGDDNNTTTRARSSYFEIEPNTTYRFSSANDKIYYVPYFYNSSKTFISYDSGWKAQTTTFTTPSNTKYLRILVKNNTTDTITLSEITEPMLNKGTTALPYVPYEKGWYYKQGIGKVVLDGSESYAIGTAGGLNRFNSSIYENIINTSSRELILSNYFHYEGGSNVVGNCFVSSARLYFYPEQTITSVPEFQNWLSTHNTIVYYPMATPTYTKITGELAQELEQVNRGMLSYDGTTNISQVNNDLAFDLVGSAITK